MDFKQHSYWYHYRRYLPFVSVYLVSIAVVEGRAQLATVFLTIAALPAAVLATNVSAFLAWYQERAEADAYRKHTGHDLYRRTEVDS